MFKSLQYSAEYKMEIMPINFDHLELFYELFKNLTKNYLLAAFCVTAALLLGILDSKDTGSNQHPFTQ